MAQPTPTKKPRRNKLMASKETERNVPGGIDCAAGASGRGATRPSRIRRTPSGTKMDFFGADPIHIQNPERTITGRKPNRGFLKPYLAKISKIRSRSSLNLSFIGQPADRDLDKLILQRQTAPESFKSVFIGHGRLRRFQPCAFHLIVVAVHHLPVGIQKLYLALTGRKLVP